MASDSPHKVILHGYWRSSCTWRVRIALNIKRINYEYLPISLIKNGGHQYAEDFRKLNPKCEVPVLQIDGHVLAQSVAIVEYLDETRPEPSLMPSEPYLRAKTRQITELVNSGIQPLQNLSSLLWIERNLGKEKKEEWGAEKVRNGLNAIEKVLGDCAGDYCVGNKITLADCCLVPQALSAAKFQVDYQEYPVIARVVDNASKLEPFRKALPENQPDAT